MERKKRRLNGILFALFFATAVGYCVWTFSKEQVLPDLGSGPYTVSAVVPTAANLTPGARVTSAGVQVGRVTAIRQQDAGALLTLEIDDANVAPLPRDTTVQIRQRTPVGENYIQLAPGEAKQLLASGAILPLRQPDDFVELDQVLSTLQGKTRGQAQELIQSLGTAVEGQGPRLNALLGNASSTLQGMSTVADVGAADRTEINQLIAATGRITSAIGERQGAITQIAEQGTTAMRALASRDKELASMLRVLPSTLAQVEETTHTLGRTTVQATPVLTNLAGAVRNLRPSVRKLRPASVQGRDVVTELGRAITPLKGTLARVRNVSPPAAAALPELKSILCQTNPMLRYAGRYKDDLASAIANMGSSVNSYDALGHLARVSVVTGENAASGLPAGLSTSLASLFHTGILSELQGMTLDPYPKPGAIGKRGLPKDRLLTTPDIAKSDYPFERVHPDC